MRPQAVYFVQCNGSDGPIKIGKAVDPARRASELRIGCPYPIVLLGHVFLPDADVQEARLHMRFAAQRIHGEWFTCSPELLEVARDARNLTAANVARMLDLTPPRKLRKARP